ncbi:hypothetical protein HYX06_05735 [Candidatus Woesearchaeota archaeon]|nr:hypothetical protein [Candidatus Woesearchaeota archaeon]
MTTGNLLVKYLKEEFYNVGKKGDINYKYKMGSLNNRAEKEWQEKVQGYKKNA